MHLLALEEQGLCCLLHVASRERQGRVTLQEISEAEGLPSNSLAPILNRLCDGGLLRGDPANGYLLARPAREVNVWEAIGVLGGELFPEGFCDCHPSARPDCAHTRDDAVSALWQKLRGALQQVLRGITLDELLRDEPMALIGPDPRASSLRVH